MLFNSLPSAWCLEEISYRSLTFSHHLVWFGYFCPSLQLRPKMLLIEPVIRNHWKKNAFQKGKNADGDVVAAPWTAQPTDDYSIPLEELDRVIRSNFFWAAARVVHEVGYQAEVLGRWSEGCPCHDSHRLVWHSSTAEERRELPKPPSCEFQSCRAPELACGSAMHAFRRAIWTSQQNIVQHVAGLSTAEQTRLRLDWDTARAKIEVQLSFKLAHWQQLPHILCGLGHFDDLVVMVVARQALALYDGGPGKPQALHTQSRRFLDPGWRGLSDVPEDLEPPLRPLVASPNFPGSLGPGA